jgi:hypothetical protein
MTRLDRLQFHLARRLGGLPPAWQRRLARAALVEVAGEVAAMLAA